MDDTQGGGQGGQTPAPTPPAAPEPVVGEPAPQGGEPTPPQAPGGDQSGGGMGGGVGA